MIKDTLIGIAGALLGSLIEEGIEEIPGVGELGITGEISGFIAALLGSKLLKKEAKQALENFVRFAYRIINKKNIDDISDEEVDLFINRFKDIPKNKKMEIINNFKNINPYEYSFIIDFLKDAKGAK